MGIVLSLSGTRTADAPESFLERAARVIRELDQEPRARVHIETDERPFLVAELHPAAEGLSLEAPDDTTVHLRAKTGTAGPGYHRHVCALALTLGDALGIEWTIDDDTDETGWLRERNTERLEESFLDWLGGAAAQILELSDSGMSGFSLSLPSGHILDPAGLVATPLGWRDEAWVRAVIDDPRHGIDVFPWWNAERDASYCLRLALTRMWTEVRWRAPLEHERAQLDEIATFVEKAHALDSTLDIPWQEQSEVLQLLGEESLRATRAHLKAQSSREERAPIGYRRRPVRAILSGGWSMRIDGELAERWEERGTWVAWDARRAVWFTSMTVADENGRPSPSTQTTLSSLPPLSGQEMLELERGDLRGLAAFAEEEREGEVLHRLEAHAARGANAAIGTIVFSDARDREWALATWGSLSHQ